MTSFKDYFSTGSSEYAEYRPGYPPELFTWLGSQCRRTKVAWDSGCGNGQAAIGLADHFDRIIATDASRAQIAAAIPHPKVSYAVGSAEVSALKSGSVDLAVVAQALHWFDLTAFWREVRRVVVTGGVFATWTYNLCRITPAIDDVVKRLYQDIVGPYWPRERAMVDTNYRTIVIPFVERPAPAFVMESRWTLQQLLGFLGTWSAVAGYRKATGSDPVELVRPALSETWGSPSEPKLVTWPLTVRAAEIA